jgi:hypothetical protein
MKQVDIAEAKAQLSDLVNRALARYVATGRIAALAGRSGRGKLVLIGPHLEADEHWYRDDGLTLQDGLNQDLFRAAVRLLD